MAVIGENQMAIDNARRWVFLNYGGLDGTWKFAFSDRGWSSLALRSSRQHPWGQLARCRCDPHCRGHSRPADICVVDDSLGWSSAGCENRCTARRPSARYRAVLTSRPTERAGQLTGPRIRSSSALVNRPSGSRRARTAWKRSHSGYRWRSVSAVWKWRFPQWGRPSKLSMISSTARK
jgi:hypothetical protein